MRIFLTSLFVCLAMSCQAFALPSFNISAPSTQNEGTSLVVTVTLSQQWGILIPITLEAIDITTSDADFTGGNGYGPISIHIPAGQTVGYGYISTVADGVECRESYKIKATSTGGNTTNTGPVYRTVNLGPIIGDANLNGTFDSNDIIAIFQAGKYETGNAATWAQGDFNGDGVFNSSDLIKALACGQYADGDPVEDFSELF